jgi:hypothetical protein
LQAAPTQLGVPCTPPAQLCAHLPQLAGSRSRSTHEPLQLVVPSQLLLQLPSLQTSLVVQAWPHAPQLAGSFEILTQAPLHSA